MNRELFADLALRARAGDQEAVEELLFLSHTPVAYQCRKILQNDQAARKLTGEILQTIQSQLDSLKDPENFESWMCRITAARCIQALRQKEREDEELIPPENVRIPRKNLDEQQTAQLVQQIADHLPDEPRLCLLLYSCGGITPRGIARLTGFSEETVLEHLSRAQGTVNIQMRKYHRMGVRFAAVTSLPELLRTAMYQSRDTKAAAEMVDQVLVQSRAVPAAPVRKRASLVSKLVVVMLLVAIVVLLMVGWLLVRKMAEVMV